MILTLIKNTLKKSIPHRWKLLLVSNIEKKKQEQFLSRLQSDIIRFYDAKTDCTFEEKEVVEMLLLRLQSILSRTQKDKF